MQTAPLELDGLPLADLRSDDTQWEEWPERPVSDGWDAEPSESAHKVSRSEFDPVRAYLGEIGRHRLLTRAQEEELGRRMEVGQHELVAALASIPYAVATITAIADRVRRREIPAE